MHFSKTLLFAASVVGLASAAAVAEPEGEIRAIRMVENFASSSPLEKRACKYNGCTCLKGTKQGQYCYNDYNSKGQFYVQKAGSGHKANDRYECNAQGGCCDYGPSSVCN